MIRKYAEIFCWKNVSSFCSAKATHIFSAKNIRILYIESAKTVNKMTLNKLVKLTTLWTTGPSIIFYCTWFFCKQTTKGLIKLSGCAGWSQPSLLLCNYLKYSDLRAWANIVDPDSSFWEVSVQHMPLIQTPVYRRPRWLSWMHRPTGDQEVAGSTPAEVGNILSWRLIVKYFLRSLSPFRWFKKGSCQFLAKECAQYWLTA